jgi:Wiskott-Aldrich syndrome protein
MSKIGAIAVVVLLAGAALVRANIYVWKDEAGVEHFTNRLEAVPEAYRAGVTTVARDWPRPEPPPEPVKSADERAPFANAPQLAAAAVAPPVVPPSVPRQEETPRPAAPTPPAIVQNTPSEVQPFIPWGLIGAGGPPGRGGGFVSSEPGAQALSPPAAMAPPPTGAGGPPPLGSAGRPPPAFGGRR